MRIKYNIFQLRFPDGLAHLCEYLRLKYNGIFIDLPYIIPIDTKGITYLNSPYVKYNNKEYYRLTINSRVVVDKKYFEEHSIVYSVVNIADDSSQYFVWVNKQEVFLDLMKFCLNNNSCSFKLENGEIVNMIWTKI